MVVLKLYELSVNQESISFQTKSELINLWLSTTRFYLQNNGFEVTGIKLLNKDTRQLLLLQQFKLTRWR